MPLVQGKSQKAISKNIEIEKNAHPDMSNKQAAAIAYSTARKSKDEETTDDDADADISKKIAELIKRGYKPDVAKAVAYAEQKRHALNTKDDDTGKTFKIYGSDSAKEYDLNGWPEIKGNPISKVGVFPYSGKQISDQLEPDTVYNVYRPEEELSDPETINSFKLLPWTDEHAMLGAEEEGMLPAERKGIHGVIGEDVYYENGYLKANLKIFSEKLARVIKEGKKELSIGYRCLYDITSGVYNGFKYDAIQRKIRGNHLASVDEGRSGPDVAVLDHFKIQCDSKELYNMPDEKRKEEGEAKDDADWTLQDCVKAVKDLMKMKDKAKDADEGEAKKELSEKTAKEGDAKDEEGLPKKFVNRARVEDDDEDKDKAKDSEEEEEMSEDEEEGETKEKKGDMKKPKDKAKDKGMDAKEFFVEIAKRNTLAEKLSHHIGTFDHSEQTYDEVAKYGIKQLKLTCKPGHEISMLEGYLAAAGTQRPVSVQDSNITSSCVDKYLGDE